MLDKLVRRVASSISDTTRVAVLQLIKYGILLFVLGTLSSLLADSMAKELSPKCASCEATPFDSVTLMLVIQCVGESSNLAVYWLLRLLVRMKWMKPEMMNFEIGNPDLPPAYWHHWIYCGLMDTTSTFLIFMAQAYLKSFTVQMVRCASLFLTAIGCIIMFQRDIRVSSWTGLFLVCLGQVFASIDYALSKAHQESGPDANPSLGFTAVIIGTLLNSMFYVMEERMWIRYSFNPMRGTGEYGLTAFIVSIIFMLIADKIGWEIWLESVHQITSSHSLMIKAACFIPIVAILNFAAISATGVGSALFTATLLAARPICTWIIGLFNKTTSRGILSILGMVFITLGLLAYMGVISRILPAWLKDKLDSDLQLRCFLLWDDEEYLDSRFGEDLEDGGSSTALVEGTTDLDLLDQKSSQQSTHGSFYDPASKANKVKIPDFVGKINVTKCPDDFYQHLVDDEWVVVDKEIEISIPEQYSLTQQTAFIDIATKTLTKP